MATPKVKVFLTHKEVIALAGLLGGMYGDIFTHLYDDLIQHLNSEDEKIANRISELLTQKIELDEDNLLYTATIDIKGHHD